MRNLSVRDLLLGLPQFKNEVELIHPDNDEVVKAALELVGFDTRQGIEYIPSNHRDIRNNVAVGFQVVGEYSHKPEMRKYMDITDLIVMAGMKDVHLAKDLLEIMGKRFNYKNEDEGDYKAGRKPNDPRYYSEEELIEMGFSTGEDEEDTYDDVDTSCEAITSQIEALQAVKEMLRGK